MRFFQVLEQLEADKSIISQEKKLLKQKITLKDIDLTHIVSTAPDEASLKDQVLSFLRQLSPMQGKYIRSKSSAQDLSPGKRGDSLVVYFASISNRARPASPWRSFASSSSVCARARNSASSKATPPSTASSKRS